MKNSDLFLNEHDYPDLDADSAVRHLSGAIRCRTVSDVDTSRMDYSTFDELYALLRRSYPLLCGRASWQRIGHSILITLPGEDFTLEPVLFMAHQDVVPIVAGTEKNWLHDPFSGDVADGYIWGRGAMDIKQMLIAHLESAELLLRRGHTFRRTVYFAFGEDEETRSTGAMAIVRHLAAQGVRLAYVLDESASDVIDAADWGAPGQLLCTIGVYEKGYADLRLTVHSRGGHSSNPFHGTSLGVLADAISTICHHMPPPCLSEAVRHSLAQLAPVITAQPMASYVKDIEAHEAELLSWFSAHESLYHLTQTTCAPTMITPGAPAGNVMPQDMSAIINFRLIPNDTPEALMARFRALLPPEVELEWAQQISASTPSDLNAWGYHALEKVLRHYFDRLIFIPVQNRGATDARQYEQICRCVLRFEPFLEEEDISAEGVHGTNERISIRAYLQGIRVLTRLMEETCITLGGT